MFVKLRGFLSTGFFSKSLANIYKTVKIFNVAYSAKPLESIYSLLARNTFILDIVLLVTVDASLFYHFGKHRPENKVVNLSLQNEIDVPAYLH